ncbi:MAG: hydantoinase/oxoprolinase family protein [Alphaproteobacteria bacterium]|nr:hydantoinase/oxoprolinase family protein [Alphaproteobacteria bacterium]
MSWRIGVDIGGTFTDLVFLADDGTAETAKVLSTPDDYSRGIVEGIAQVLKPRGVDPATVREVLHGTTVATNAILEHKGAKVGLITTEGFRDTLEIRRLRMPQLYDLNYVKPLTLVPRRWRTEVVERILHTGEVLVPLDEAGARTAIDMLIAAGVDAIAVCLINAYVDGRHERRIRELVRLRDQHLPVCLSSEILPEIKEYERTSTTVVNAYIVPVVENYLRRLTQALKELGIASPLMVMQSNGGAMGVQAASERPIHIIESGPAAGVVGGAEVARKLGLDNVLTFDMGGTTAKASMVEKGRYDRLGEMDVGAGINLAGRLLKGGGYHVRVPAIDIAEVGAGGGSIVRIDAGGALKVGPDSAGAMPGPVCYDQGGQDPTVTDCNVILGFLSPDYLVGGGLKLARGKAVDAMQSRIAGPLGMSLEAAAWGVHVVANASMARALRAVSSERGRDPRDYALLAFGGNGPVHAVTLAQSMNMRRVLVPPVSGVFSALGLLFPETEHHYVRTFKRRLEAADPAEMTAAFEQMRAEGRQALAVEGYGEADSRFEMQADLRYLKENSELTVAIDGIGDFPAKARARFDQAHEQAYGYSSADEQAEVVNLRLIARGISKVSRVPAALTVHAGGQAKGPSARHRRAYFGAEHGWHNTPVLRRAEVPRSGQAGPLIVEEYDSTTVVPPGCRVALGDWQALTIDIGR